MLIRDLTDQLVSIAYCTVAMDKSLILLQQGDMSVVRSWLKDMFVYAHFFFPHIADSLLHFQSIFGDFMVR